MTTESNCVVEPRFYPGQFMKIVPFASFTELALELWGWDEYFKEKFLVTKWAKATELDMLESNKQQFLKQWYSLVSDEIKITGFFIFETMNECRAYCKSNNLSFNETSGIKEYNPTLKTEGRLVGDVYNDQDGHMFWMICENADQFDKFTFLSTAI